MRHLTWDDDDDDHGSWSDDAQDRRSSYTLPSTPPEPAEAASPPHHNALWRIPIADHDREQAESSQPWTELEDRLLILYSMGGDFRDDQIAAKIAFFFVETNAEPLRFCRLAQEIHQRIAVLMNEGRISQRWRNDSLSDNMGIPFTITEDLEILRWHVSNTLCLDASLFVPYNRSGMEIKYRRYFLTQDSRLVSIIRAYDGLIRDTTYRFHQLRDHERDPSRRSGVITMSNRHKARIPKTEEELQRHINRRKRRMRTHVQVALKYRAGFVDRQSLAPPDVYDAQISGPTFWTFP